MVLFSRSAGKALREEAFEFNEVSMSRARTENSAAPSTPEGGTTFDGFSEQPV
ncbi:MAG: hypothetical protein R2729_16185 [Bryobacteraceae bacterium]